MLLLTQEQLETGRDSLVDGKLTASQVTDLVSVFRAFLGEIAGDYDLETVFTEQDDTSGGKEICAKLATCLFFFQDNQFGVAGFEATNANREGFYYSQMAENFEVFKYAFGLLWIIPANFTNRFISKQRSRRTSTVFFQRVSS